MSADFYKAATTRGTSLSELVFFVKKDRTSKRSGLLLELAEERGHVATLETENARLRHKLARCQSGLREEK